MAQAENWQELAQAVKEVDEALKSIPAPPVPNDDFGKTMNGVNGNFNQLKEVVYNQANLELEREEEE